MLIRTCFLTRRPNGFYFIPLADSLDNLFINFEYLFEISYNFCPLLLVLLFIQPFLPLLFNYLLLYFDLISYSVLNGFLYQVLIKFVKVM